MAVLNAFILFSATAGLAAGSQAFLSSRGSQLSQVLVEEALMAELPGSADKNRLEDLQRELQVLFNALPKNDDGLLEEPAVRFALDRHFKQKYGWSVKGLDVAGGSWHSSDQMQDWVPGYVFKLFSQRMQGHGLDLASLASFAATLADLIHGDGIGHLQRVWVALGLSTIDRVSEDDLDLAIRGFLAEIIVNQGAEVVSRSSVVPLERESRDRYPEYDEILMWTRDMRQTRLWQDAIRRNPFVEHRFSFSFASDLVVGILHTYVEVTRTDCRQLKTDLVDMEVAGSGRISLPTFFANQKLQFHENIDYLRALGALESEGTNTRLLLSNYLFSQSKCIGFSSFFSTCCEVECEGLMAQVERAIAGPSAKPDRIIEAISSLESDTVAAPRQLSAVLIDRLGSIARHHQGDVPLHGRLFMQWMHYAFPRECPFPHVSHTTNPMLQDDWLNKHPELNDVTASHKEKSLYIEEKSDTEVSDFDLEALPWTEVEELVGSGKSPSASSFKWWLRVLLVVGALMSLAVPLWHATLQASSSAEAKIHAV